MNFLTVALNFIYFSCTSCNRAPQPSVNKISAGNFLTTTVAELRKSSVKENLIYSTSDYGGGNWTYDPNDVSSEDNLGTVLITQYGQRLKRSYQGPLNVRWFGAKGDSITDETDAFNKALDAAHNQKQSLYIPTGVYSCNKIDKNKHILEFNGGSLDNITIYGDGPGSKITSSSNASSLLLYIFAYSNCAHLTIRDIFFESNHPVMLNYSHGIMIQGTKGENFKNLVVTGCKFEGFSTTLLGQGLNGVEISNSVFNSPLGHDNAQNNSSPAVYVWFFDNNNGYCSDIKITNNTANGYSGTKPMSALSSKRPMDGFIYGTGYGYLIDSNKTKFFSEEHIAIAPPATFPTTTKQIIISNNELDGAIPVGSKNQDGSFHTGNYAIRCDASHSTITNNSIHNFTIGIMVRTYDYPFVQTGDIKITGNTLVSTQEQQNCQISNGILVQGSLKKRLHNVSIKKNKINVANGITANFFSGIALYDTDSATVENNQIDISNLISKNSGNNFGISYGRVRMISDINNLVTNITPRNKVGSSDQVMFTDPL